MARCELVGNASTQSRARRPLPPGATRGITMNAYGVNERVMFEYATSRTQIVDLLSWIGGQAGLLWGGPIAGWLPGIQDAILDNAGSIHGSYGHITEHALADALGDIYAGHIISDEMAVRFFQNGGDACAAAVRIARVVPGGGRDTIASFGYHGASVDFAHEPDWHGQRYSNMQACRQFDFGDVTIMRALARTSACIILEVPAWDDEAAIASFLRECRVACDLWDIPLIIDDVVGGFRFGLAGSCERYGVKADMVCLGKAISATGGVSALIGRRDLVGMLDSGVFYSTTFGGNPGPISVANATVRWLAEHRSEVYGESGHLQTIGRALKDGFNERGIKCIGQPERSIFAFESDDAWLAWCSRMIGSGVMVHRPNFPTLAHRMEHVRQTMEAVEGVAVEVVR